MNPLPITSAPVDAADMPLFPDLEYHDRIERQNRVLRWTVAAIAAATLLQGLAVFKIGKNQLGARGGGHPN